MASIGLLTQQTLGGVNFKSFSSALSFQCNILASAFGFFAILSAVPLVHRSFIECECDPSHVKKDIIETECLTGKLSSLVEEDRYVIQHNSYQDLPYLFVLFMLVNMIPTVICGELYSKRVLNTVKNMNNFNKHEDEGRASRLLDIFWNHLPDLAKNYLARLICEFFGLVSMAYQVYFWETTLNGVFSSWNYASSRSYYSIFPQIATCETTTIAPGGEEDKEYFKCILTMNRFYGASFKILAVLYAIGGLLQLMSLLCFTLLLLSPFRRYEQQSIKNLQISNYLSLSD